MKQGKHGAAKNTVSAQTYQLHQPQLRVATQILPGEHPSGTAELPASLQRDHGVENLTTEPKRPGSRVGDRHRHGGGDRQDILADH